MDSVTVSLISGFDQCTRDGSISRLIAIATADTGRSFCLPTNTGLVFKVLAVGATLSGRHRAEPGAILKDRLPRLCGNTGQIHGRAARGDEVLHYAGPIPAPLIPKLSEATSRARTLEVAERDITPTPHRSARSS